jgi:hypothetical protein
MQDLYINTALFICNNTFGFLKITRDSVIHAEPPIACIICNVYLVNRAVVLFLIFKRIPFVIIFLYIIL